MKTLCLVLLTLSQPPSGAYQKSLALVEFELAERPDDLRLLDALGHVHFRRQQYARAAEIFERCTRLDPGSFGAWMGLGGACMELAREEQAIDAFQRAIGLAPPRATIPARFRLAALYRREGRLDDAIKELRIVVKTNDAQKEAWLELGDLLRTQSRRAAGDDRRARERESLAALEKVTSLDPENHTAHYVLAMIHRGRGEKELAREHLEASARLRPRVQGKRPQTEVHESRFEVTTLMTLASVFRKTGSPEKVALYAEKALALIPDHVPALTAKAAILLEVNRLHPASEIYTRILELEPENSTALMALGSIHITVGDIEKGAGMILRASRANPDNANAWEWLFRLAMERRIHGERTEEFARKALKARPSPHNHRVLAYFLFETARREECFQVLERGLAAYPDNEELTTTRRALLKASEK